MSEYLRPVLPAAGAEAPGLVLGEQPFDVAANSFRLLTSGPEPLSIDGAALGGGLPSRRIALSELAAILMHPSCGYTTSDQVWRLLIEQARTGGPAWVVGAAGVALPGLRQAAYRLRHYSGDVQAELLTAFVAALRTVKPGGAKVAQRLLSATFTAARAALHTDQPHRTQVPVPMPMPVFAPVGRHPDTVLARAVAAGVITAAEAELIGATRLEGVPVADYAERAGRNYWAVVKERSRRGAPGRGGTRRGAVRPGRSRDRRGDVDARGRPGAPRLTCIFTARCPNEGRNLYLLMRDFPAPGDLLRPAPSTALTPRYGPAESLRRRTATAPVEVTNHPLLAKLRPTTFGVWGGAAPEGAQVP